MAYFGVQLEREGRSCHLEPAVDLTVRVTRTRIDHPALLQRCPRPAPHDSVRRLRRSTASTMQKIRLGCHTSTTKSLTPGKPRTVCTFPSLTCALPFIMLFHSHLISSDGLPLFADDNYVLLVLLHLSDGVCLLHIQTSYSLVRILQSHFKAKPA